MKKGFALVETVETIIMIAIVGLLAAIAITSFKIAREQVIKNREMLDQTVLERGQELITPASQYRVEELFKIKDTTFWKFTVDGETLVYAERFLEMEMVHLTNLPIHQ